MMHNELMRLRDLAQRVSRGDGTAAETLLGALEPRMVCIVRRVMRTQARKSPLAERILVEADRLQGQQRPLALGGELASQVAHNVCLSIVEQLRGTPDGWSTICETLRL